jgi:hypothetical protein
MALDIETNHNAVADRREKMMSYTQDELSSFWQNLADRTKYDALDVRVLAAMKIETAVEQTLMFPSLFVEVETYNDFNPPSDPPKDRTTISYIRIRRNKEAPWGVWERKN